MPLITLRHPIIDCELEKLEQDDFLFQKGMEWGKPNFDQLLGFMRDAYEKRVRVMDHTHTRKLVGRVHHFRARLETGGATAGQTTRDAAGTTIEQSRALRIRFAW